MTASQSVACNKLRSIEMMQFSQLSEPWKIRKFIDNYHLTIFGQWREKNCLTASMESASMER